MLSKKIRIPLLITGALLSVAGMAFFHGEYLAWENIPLLFILSAISITGAGLIGAVICSNAEKCSKAKTVLCAASAALFFAALQWGVSFFINVIIGKEQLNLLAINVTSAILCLYLGILTALALRRLTGNRTVNRIVPVVALLCFLAAGLSYTGSYIFELSYKNYRVASPVLGQEITERGDKMTDFDFYVSVNGNDNNDGSREAPFLTIQRAVEAVRNTDKSGKDGINVCITEGEYRVSSLVFTKEDSGTETCPVTYYAEGEVILNGGATLSPDDFVSVKEYPDIADRLTEEAKEKVYVLDVTKEPYGLTSEDWGKIYAIGSYNTANKYDGDFVGPLYCELFVNDQRQTLARYPDSGFLYTEKVISTGDGYESNGATTKSEAWSEARNPESDVYEIKNDLAEQIDSWQTFDDVWMMGYWKYDWADASTPIGDFNKENRTLSPKFVSLYGTKIDAPYYFFNVLEELTAEGEWYLDRKNGLLCLYTANGFSQAQIDISLSLDCIIKADADYLTFDGFTVKGTRGDAISITGNNNTVQHCLIKNVAGNALIMDGYNNLAYNNEITRTGRGGIILNGGDSETLTAGNNKADNNYIHDWSEIYLTYQPAVTLNGVGNICSHNEMVNSPHEAITWSGNNHTIEYNLIHDVCLLSDDAGAIYSGRRWDWYGTVIRYNAIYNLGSDGHTPDGIYLDDALSGHEVYGNLLINIPKLGIHLGGGRDLEVWGNIIINAGQHPISYDARAREGALENGWFNHSSKKDGDMWQNLYNSPWQSEIWQTAYPQYKSYIEDFEKSEEAGFVPNPGNSTVSGNIILDKAASIGNISEAAEKFSDISGNAIFKLSKLDNIFTDAENGDYTILNMDKIREQIPDFEEIPLNAIGRQ